MAMNVDKNENYLKILSALSGNPAMRNKELEAITPAITAKTVTVYASLARKALGITRDGPLVKPSYRRKSSIEARLTEARELQADLAGRLAEVEAKIEANRIEIEALTAIGKIDVEVLRRLVNTI
jgi:hypothetical protein